MGPRVVLESRTDQATGQTQGRSRPDAALLAPGGNVLLLMEEKVGAGWGTLGARKMRGGGRGGERSRPVPTLLFTWSPPHSFP